MLKWLRDTMGRAQEEAERKKREKQEAAAREAERKAKVLAEQEAARARKRQLQENILAILRDDKLPMVDAGSTGPFKLLKSERLIYVFHNVEYAEQVVKREFRGGHAGVSFRVAKGVSLRTGRSRGHSVENLEIEHRGSGVLAVASKHLYFSGERSFRIPFGKIVSVSMADDDVVEITRDRAKGLPEYFAIGPDARFAHDLIQAVPSLELPRQPETIDPSDYHLLMFQGDVGDSLDG